VARYDLQRFVAAQDEGGAYEAALAELRAGHKTSHWMWFVFPQRVGLGQSAMSQRYALCSLEETSAYFEHPVLGLRLAECAQALLSHEGLSAAEILGGIDAMKLRSSMTLFATVCPEQPEFGQLLERYFDGEPDPAALFSAVAP
jgi:uncharacterized protein (DUF1810 family)